MRWRLPRRTAGAAGPDAVQGNTVDGIDEFEKNLERMREDPKTSRIKVLGKNVVEASAELTVGKIKPLTGVDPVEHLQLDAELSAQR